MSSDRTYRAFISYRHADNSQEGRKWATWLHQALETYEIPAELVGTRKGAGEPIPERLFPIFRDEEELPVDANLETPIHRALECSECLIVICSPRAVESEYVASEITCFKQLGKAGRILALIIDGEPNASTDQGKQSHGFSPADECFPDSLKYHVDEEGRISTRRTEPIAADLRLVHPKTNRPEEGWTSPEAYRQHLKLNHQLSEPDIRTRVEDYRQVHKLMLLKVISGILQVPLGELTKRDQVYQLEQERGRARRLRMWLGAVGALAIVALVAGMFAVFAKREAQEQEGIAQAEAEAASRSEYGSEINLAQSLIAQNSFSRARRVLKDTAPRFRSLEFGYLESQVNPSIRSWSLGFPCLAVWGSDSGHAHLGANGEGIFDFEAPDTLVHRWQGTVDRVQFGGGGKLAIGYVTEQTAELQIYSLIDGTLRTLDLPAELSYEHFDIARDESLIAFVGTNNEEDDWRVFVYDLTTLKELASTTIADWIPRYGTKDVQFLGKGRVLIQPGPDGTGAFPSAPLYFDYGSGQMIDGPSPEFGSLVVAQLSDQILVHGMHNQFGVMRNDPPEDVEDIGAGDDASGLSAFVETTVGETVYRIEELIAIPERSQFAVRDSGNNIQFFRCVEGVPEIESKMSYGSSTRIIGVVPSQGGGGVYVCNEDGTVEFLMLDSFRGKPHNMNPYSIYVGDNFGWAGRLSLAQRSLRVLESKGAAVSTWVHRLGPVEGEGYTPRNGLASAPFLFRATSMDLGADDRGASGIGEETELAILTPGQMDQLFEDPSSTLQPNRVEIPAGAVSFAVSLDCLTVGFQVGETVQLNNGQYPIELPVGALLCGISNSGRNYAFRNGNSVWIGNVEHPEGMIEVQTDETGHYSRGEGVTFHPSGERCALWMDASTIGLLDTATGRVLVSLDVSANNYPGGDIRFTADGRMLYSKSSVQISSSGRDTTMIIWSDRSMRQLGHAETN